MLIDLVNRNIQGLAAGTVQGDKVLVVGGDQETRVIFGNRWGRVQLRDSQVEVSIGRFEVDDTFLGDLDLGIIGNVQVSGAQPGDRSPRPSERYQQVEDELP